MTRRSPPSHLTFLPSHLPTPPRGAPKYSLPTLPPLIPTTTRPSLSVPKRRHPSISGLIDLDELKIPEPPYVGVKVAQEGDRPPWVRSRGIDLAEKELKGVRGGGLRRPQEVVIGR